MRTTFAKTMMLVVYKCIEKMQTGNAEVEKKNVRQNGLVIQFNRHRACNSSLRGGHHPEQDLACCGLMKNQPLS